jgi:putative hemolysin
VALAQIIVFLGVLVFAAASFFFALAESSLFSLGKWRARQLLERDPVAGQSVTRLLEHSQDLLATIVLGNTLANAALVATALWLALDTGGMPLGLTLAGLLALVLLGCEVVPKTLALRMPEPWALRVAGPMALLVWVTGPLRRVAQAVDMFILRAVVPKSVQPVSALTDEDYRELLELAFLQGTLGKSEKEIILQIVSLDRRTAKEVMKPRSRMASIPDDLSVENMIAAARLYKHRRLPIYDETPDTIVGVLNTRALLLDPQIDLADAIEFPSFVPETMNLLQLFKSLQKQQRGLAIVLDEFGGTAGVVTMEDILEEIVGEIRSEVAETGFVYEKLGDGRWRVNGTMRLDDFRREFPPLGEVADLETMAGLMVAESEVVPSVGQSIVFRGLKFTAQVADDRRVREILVERIKSA